MLLVKFLPFVCLALLPWRVLSAHPGSETKDSTGRFGGSGVSAPSAASSVGPSDGLLVARNDSVSRQSAPASVSSPQEPASSPPPPNTGIARDTDLGSVLKQPWECLHQSSSNLTLFDLPEVVASEHVTQKQEKHAKPRQDARQGNPAPPLTTPVLPLASPQEPGGSRTAGTHMLDFDYAEWVGRKDLAEFESYVRERQSSSDGGDIGRLHGKDMEYIYEIYFKGQLSPYLDTSERWSVDIVGGLIEQVDGVSRLLKAVQDSFLTNNLFRPSNPFRKFADSMVGSRPRPSDPRPFQVPRLPGPTWKWKGDLHVKGASLFEGLELDEVTLEIGRLWLSEQVEIKFDLFYLDE
jgi:hypothetical protein